MIDAEEIRRRQHGPLRTDGKGEFRCEDCHARCTRSPTKDIEYGHRAHCSRRPDHLPNGGPVFQNDSSEPVATDGGDER